MSAETLEWLNNYTLIGYKDKRGNAWHYRDELQEGKSNHYKGPVPVADVLSRLFNFEVVEMPLYIVGADGRRKEIPGRKAMVTSDTFEVLGIFKDGYQGHSYKEWLVDNVATILDADLAIGSAGLLKNRAQAFVSIEMEDTITTPEGVDFRPQLLAVTSFDGSLASDYGQKITVTVCDNTMQMALGEQGMRYKVKHSKYSLLRIKDAREALNIVHTMADDFAAEIATLCDWKVTDEQFVKHLDMVVPLPEIKEGQNPRGFTVAEKKRDEIISLYRQDERCKPWQDTAFGVLQAHNTWVHHAAQVRKGVPRFMRNMENVVKGKYAEHDSDVLTKLAVVCGRES